MATLINADTSDGLKLTSDTSGEIEFQSAGVTKVTMDTSGNVGIGTASPTAKLHVSDTGTGTLISSSSDTTNTGFSWSDGTISGVLVASGVGGTALYTQSNHPTVFGTNNTERMRIDSSGSVFVGPTATQNGATGVVYSKTTAKAWVTFTGTTGAILSSFNVSSVTRVSAGVYTVNFTSAMPNANYSSFYMAQPTVSNAGSDTFTINPTTTTLGCNHWEANTARDSSYSCVVVFGSA
jgi:hypothetical protein